MRSFYIVKHTSANFMLSVDSEEIYDDGGANLDDEETYDDASISDTVTRAQTTPTKPPMLSKPKIGDSNGFKARIAMFEKVSESVDSPHHKHLYSPSVMIVIPTISLQCGIQSCV